MNGTARLVFIIALWFCAPAQAKPLSPEQVPEPLKPWVDWVLLDNREAVCPFIYNSYEQKHCSWPSQLNLDFSASHGSFTSAWQVYLDSWIILPGDSRHWPVNVTVNNKTALVLNRNGSPAIQLDAGYYQIQGEFFWDQPPDNLSLPANTGLIGLVLNGKAISTPALKDGQLWLKASDTGQNGLNKVENTLDLQVFRKLIDEVPTQVLTRLELNVSGEQRETTLAMPMLAGFIPMHITSPLPARLEPDGSLLVQIRPGRWAIEVLARAPQDLPELTLGQIPSWPESEIWSFEARPALRIAEIEQAEAIDPSQTAMPENWKQLPAYRINPGQALRFKVIRRGDPEPEPNQLSLTRRLWLDFNGGGYTVNDHINGRMNRGWRLNAQASAKLGRATLNGDNQLITREAQTGLEGVEVRQGQIDLDADSRQEHSISTLSATGWQQNFNSVNAELFLPPGWRLLAVSGVDNLPDSWLARWTLLDLFLVLIAALAAGRLWHAQWGALVLVTLGLIWHEPGSPQLVWLNILAATALIAVLPEGKFLKAALIYRRVCGVALILIAVPFFIGQIRQALYPQLENPWQTITPPVYQPQASAALEMEEAPAPMQDSVSSLAEMKKPAPATLRSTAAQKPNLDQHDPNAKVQTGPGLPQWQWTSVQLAWNGSVDSGQSLHLFYSPPWLTAWLNLIRVLLICALALLMFGGPERFKRLPKLNLPGVAGWLLLPLLWLPPESGFADIPDQALLDQLRERLQAPPDCLPACADSPQMQLTIDSQLLDIRLQINTQQTVAVPLPANYGQWLPAQVFVDGQPALGLMRQGNELWLNLAAGPHQVILRGAVPASGKFDLPLPFKPHRFTYQSSLWQITGALENGQVEDQLQFIRQNTSQSVNTNTLEPGQLPPFFSIERHLQLGLNWEVTTRIQRLTPPGTAVSLSVPLLPGEAVTSAGIRVKDGQAQISMAGQDSFFQWQSSLEKTGKIDLTATHTQQWVEIWRADLTPIWHLETSGLAMMHPADPSHWQPEWRPWPGEQVTLLITRPEAVSGQTLTIDHSRLSLKPGQRAQEATLSLNLRSSQGGQHTLTLPEQAELQSVSINGVSQPARQQAGKVTVPVSPGTQDIVLTWQQVTGLPLVLTSPQIDLGAASVNSFINLSLGQDRWVLFAFGPIVGPAVLFWGVLIVIGLLSAALGRVPLTPLTARHWFLLLIGLSQIPLPGALVVITWLMLLGWRYGNRLDDSRHFNALQVAITILTVFALSLLFSAVEQGLLGSPSMQITGNQSTATDLNWYQDRAPGLLPQATVVSVPLMVYRLLMLAWSLWLAASLLNWLKWGWRCFAQDGLWKKAPPKPKPENKANPNPKTQAQDPNTDTDNRNN